MSGAGDGGCPWQGTEEFDSLAPGPPEGACLPMYSTAGGAAHCPCAPAPAPGGGQSGRWQAQAAEVGQLNRERVFLRPPLYSGRVLPKFPQMPGAGSGPSSGV